MEDRKFRCYTNEEKTEYVDVEAPNITVAKARAKKLTGQLLFWDIEELKEADPEEEAYRKYIWWRNTCEPFPHDFNRDEVGWGEDSDRGFVMGGPACPLSEEEKRLAAKYAKFINDRDFWFKEYMPF